MMVMMQTIECGSDLNRRALEKILLQAAAGEKDALELLYHQTRAAVYGMALSILKNPHDAQDVAQDTFARVWECAPQYCARRGADGMDFNDYPESGSHKTASRWSACGIR